MNTKGIASTNALIAGALALAACSGPTSEASTTSSASPSSSVTAPPANGGTYPTVVALKSASLKAGVIARHSPRLTG